MSLDSAAPAERRNVDFTLMYAAHEAFRRDLRRLEGAAENLRLTDPGLYAGWTTFHQQLDVHHRGEDVALWPELRAATGTPSEAAVIDAMESEHKTIELLLAGVDGCLALKDRSGLLETTGFLSEALRSHMEHEERDALPLVEQLLGERGWKAFTRYMGRAQGLKGGAVFFPWMLEEAPESTVAHILGKLPAPVRVLYRRLWQPRYARALRWDRHP